MVFILKKQQIKKKIFSKLLSNTKKRHPDIFQLVEVLSIRYTILADSLLLHIKEFITDKTINI